MIVHHLALRTDDVPRLTRFYSELVGLSVLRRKDAGSVWLEAGSTIVMIEARATHEPRIERTSMELTCFAIEPDALGDFLRRLRDAGVTIEGRTAHSIYLRDPDGRRIGVSSYPLALPEPI